PSFLGGSNFAIAGARTSGDPTSLLAQTSLFLTSLGGGAADQNALYVVWGGGNNVRDALLDPLHASAIVSSAVSDIGGIVGQLASHGARHFLVPDLPDLGKIPGVTSQGPLASAFASQLSVGFNSGLTVSLVGLATLFPSDDFHELDTFDLFNSV